MKSTESETAHHQAGIKWLAWDRETKTEKISEIFSSFSHRKDESMNSENWKFLFNYVPHKDWELPNSQIWLAEMDIDHGLEVKFCDEKIITQNKNKSKSLIRKKVKRMSKIWQILVQFITIASKMSASTN